VDKDAKPGIRYTYSVVPVFYGTVEKFSDLVQSVPDAILEGASSLQIRAEKVLPNFSGAVLIRGKAASSAPLAVK
jgi:hypothetical protein